MYTQDLKYDLKFYLEKILKYSYAEHLHGRFCEAHFNFQVAFTCSVPGPQMPIIQPAYTLRLSATCTQSVYVRTAILNWEIKWKGHNRTLGAGAAWKKIFNILT